MNLLAKIDNTIWQVVPQRVLVFESVTTGAANDIEQATKIARAMVTHVRYVRQVWNDVPCNS